MNQRRRILFCLALVALSASQVMTQKQTPPAQPPAPQKQRSMREIVMMPVVYRVPGMDQVTVKSDLKYTAVNNPYLLMDVYTPPDLAKSERLPAVLFIHGGAGAETRPKDWGIYKSWGRLVAASGMVGVTFTHRLGYPKPLLAESLLIPFPLGRGKRGRVLGERSKPLSLPSPKGRGRRNPLPSPKGRG